MKKKILKKS
jgi:hypothetical protein